MATVTEGVLHPSMRYTGDLLLGDSVLFSSFLLGEIKGPLHSNFIVFLKGITQKMSFDSNIFFVNLEIAKKMKLSGLKRIKKTHIKGRRPSGGKNPPTP